MKQVMMFDNSFLTAETEEELEDLVFEDCDCHVTVVHGGPNLNVEHEIMVERLFDQCMATMEDVDEEG